MWLLFGALQFFRTALCNGHTKKFPYRTEGSVCFVFFEGACVLHLGSRVRVVGIEDLGSLVIDADISEGAVGLDAVGVAGAVAAILEAAD